MRSPPILLPWAANGLQDGWVRWGFGKKWGETDFRAISGPKRAKNGYFRAEIVKSALFSKTNAQPKKRSEWWFRVLNLRLKTFLSDLGGEAILILGRSRKISI